MISSKKKKAEKKYGTVIQMTCLHKYKELYDLKMNASKYNSTLLHRLYDLLNFFQTFCLCPSDKLTCKREDSQRWVNAVERFVLIKLIISLGFHTRHQVSTPKKQNKTKKICWLLASHTGFLFSTAGLLS